VRVWSERFAWHVIPFSRLRSHQRKSTQLFRREKLLFASSPETAYVKTVFRNAAFTQLKEALKGKHLLKRIRHPHSWS
jgi:hypothetical protein